MSAAAAGARSVRRRLQRRQQTPRQGTRARVPPRDPYLIPQRRLLCSLPPTPPRCFLQLPPPARACLLETLTSNLSSLAASAESLLEEWDSAGSSAVTAHKAALKMTIFLLHCVAAQACDEAERAPAAPAAAGRGRGAAGELIRGLRLCLAARRGGAGLRRGAARAGGNCSHRRPFSATCVFNLPGKSKKRGKRDDDDDDLGDQGDCGAWDWEWGRAAVLRALRPALAADLRALFGGVAGVERAAGLALEMVGCAYTSVQRAACAQCL